MTLTPHLFSICLCAVQYGVGFHASTQPTGFFNYFYFFLCKSVKFINHKINFPVCAVND